MSPYSPREHATSRHVSMPHHHGCHMREDDISGFNTPEHETFAEGVGLAEADKWRGGMQGTS